eukprot:CAMPEP_0172501038 /NCGR_PEP_ID=MMETSP1066-20121228/145465_1 /TAXON_ID=671091 /ORGANISM="Coscinodiscus wailesii, Strain CCMP2513" /LENGTH=126 /DNA_ID=CAMNT_0013275611 /DNA_START=158 /DNA_END=538 /DNA_ORIENTATION=+
MAAAVDAQVAKFRTLQEDIQKLRSDHQTLLGQQNENDMVKQELDLLDDTSTVHKMVGPVLMTIDLDEAKQVVEKRLEFISGEISKIEGKLKEREEDAQRTAEKIQQMQSEMQAAAAAAARQIAQQG